MCVSAGELADGLGHCNNIFIMSSLYVIIRPVMIS